MKPGWTWDVWSERVHLADALEGPQAVAEGDAAADEDKVDHRDADVVGKPRNRNFLMKCSGSRLMWSLIMLSIGLCDQLGKSPSTLFLAR